MINIDIHLRDVPVQSASETFDTFAVAHIEIGTTRFTVYVDRAEQAEAIVNGFRTAFPLTASEPEEAAA